MAMAMLLLLIIPVVVCDTTEDTIVDALWLLDNVGMEMDQKDMKLTDDQPKLQTLKKWAAENYPARDFLLFNVCNARKAQWGIFETWTRDEDEYLLNQDTYLRQFRACSNCQGWRFMKDKGFRTNSTAIKKRYATKNAWNTYTALRDAGTEFYQKQSPFETLTEEFIRQTYNDSQSSSRRHFCKDINAALTNRKLEKSEWMCLIACKALGDLDNVKMHRSPSLRRQSSTAKRSESFKKQNSGDSAGSSF